MVVEEGGCVGLSKRDLVDKVREELLPELMATVLLMKMMMRI